MNLVPPITQLGQLYTFYSESCDDFIRASISRIAHLLEAIASFSDNLSLRRHLAMNFAGFAYLCRQFRTFLSFSNKEPSF